MMFFGGKKISSLAVLFMAAACTQTGQQGTQTDALQLASQTPAPPVEITETAVGNANIKLIMRGSNQAIYNRRACELGKYAQRSEATHILAPSATEIKTVVIDGNSFQMIDHPFEYFVSGQQAPDGARTSEFLLKQCTA